MDWASGGTEQIGTGDALNGRVEDYIHIYIHTYIHANIFVLGFVVLKVGTSYRWHDYV